MDINSDIAKTGHLSMWQQSLIFLVLKFYVQHVCQVLQKPMQHRLYRIGEKCEFDQYTISFLGYVITPYGPSQYHWLAPTSINQGLNFRLPLPQLLFSSIQIQLCPLFLRLTPLKQELGQSFHNSPVTFFLRKLSVTENYIGKQEQLAKKVPLEE